MTDFSERTLDLEPHLRLFLLQGSFRSATRSEKKSCIQMRDLLGNKGKRVVVDVSKMRFGQGSSIKAK